MNNQRVVVYVDDDIDDLETFTELFTSIENAPPLKTFEWPDTALEYLKTQDLDKLKCFLLVDVNLRITDGFDFIEEVRKQAFSKDLHIALITTSRSSREVIKAEGMGVQMIVKPSTIDGLQQVAESIVAHCNSL